MSFREQLQNATNENNQVGLKVKEYLEMAQKAADNGEHMIVDYLQNRNTWDHQEFWDERDLEKIKEILESDEYKLDVNYRTDEEDEDGAPIWRIMIDWM